MKSYCPICGAHDGAHIERYHAQREALLATIRGSAGSDA